MTNYLNEHVNDDYVIKPIKIETYEANSLQSKLIEKMVKDLPDKTGEEENRKIRNRMVEDWKNKYAKVVREIIDNPLNVELRDLIKGEELDDAAENIQEILEKIPTIN
jgi:hypothetical protein